MRKIPVFLVLILIALWAYTSWYWYTCKIKGFCSIGTVEQVQTDTSNNTVIGTPEAPLVTLEDTQEKAGRGDGMVKMSGFGTAYEAGDLGDLDNFNPANWDDEKREIEEEFIEPEVCEDILSKAISLGSTNDKTQVQNLENFLNKSEGESLDVDGRYSQDDFDAVKRFQLKYRSDILDPWGVSTPTGYVYTTTIKKVNEIHCSK